MSLLTHQPRWLLLSAFLVLWSWSSAFRRDPSRAKPLSIGVEARVPFEGHWQEKRQVGFPMCAQQCIIAASDKIGCGASMNFACACHSAQFPPAAVDCMTATCSASDKAAGQSALMIGCRAVGTSVSLPTSFSVSSTSITSGVPPISTSVSPSSASETSSTSVSISVTGTTTLVTDSSTASTTGTTSTPTPTPSPSHSSTSTPVPVTTSTTSATATVTIPSAPVTTIGSTTTAGSSSTNSATGGSNGAHSLTEGMPTAALALAAFAVLAGAWITL